MLAQAVTGTPGHVNTVANAAAHFIRRIGANNMKDGDVMNGKGKRFVPDWRRVDMACPRGAGYGPVSDRDRAAIHRDLACGYISRKIAQDTCGISAEDADDIMDCAKNGEQF